MIPLCNGFYLFPLSRAVNSNSLIFGPSEFKIGLYPVGYVQTVSEEFLMAMDGILFCAYRLIFMVPSLTFCNRFSFDI